MRLNEEQIEKIRDGVTFLYPTDTIWGIGCDATNEASCQEILKIKERPADKSFILLVDSFQMLEKYIPEFNPVCYDLVDLSTKPLTIIYPNAKDLAPSVLAADGSVGIRITKDPLCVNIIRMLKKPIVSTSANESGANSPINFDAISDKIKKEVGIIFEHRLQEEMRQSSQIIKIDLNGEISILRK